MAVSASAPGLEQFMDALIGQESGGNVGAVNDRTQAFGLGQIMPSNWYPWATEAGVDPNDYSEHNQREVIAFKLNQYYQNFGNWADVASAWYSGQPMSAYSDATLDAPQGYGNEPSIREYVNKLLGRMDSSTATSSYGYSARADHLSEPFGSRLDAFLAAFGGRVWINSGYRSIEEQTALYNADPNSGYVAPPGSSKHNYGMAADLGWDNDATLVEMHAAAASYGLYFPMLSGDPYEPWHIEPIGSRDGTYVEAVGPNGEKGANVKNVKIPGTFVDIPLNPLDSVKDMGDLAVKFGKWFNLRNMYRILLFLAGSAVFLLGIVAMMRKPANDAIAKVGAIL